jgi:hypothetical protein
LERSGRLVVRKGGAETRAIPSILNLIQSTIRTIKKGQGAALQLPWDSHMAALSEQHERGEKAAGCEEMAFELHD